MTILPAQLEQLFALTPTSSPARADTGSDAPTFESVLAESREPSRPARAPERERSDSTRAETESKPESTAPSDDASAEKASAPETETPAADAGDESRETSDESAADEQPADGEATTDEGQTNSDDQATDEAADETTDLDVAAPVLAPTLAAPETSVAAVGDASTGEDVALTSTSAETSAAGTDAARAELALEDSRSEHDAARPHEASSTTTASAEAVADVDAALNGMTAINDAQEQSQQVATTPTVDPGAENRRQENSSVDSSTRRETSESTRTSGIDAVPVTDTARDVPESTVRQVARTDESIRAATTTSETPVPVDVPEAPTTPLTTPSGDGIVHDAVADVRATEVTETSSSQTAPASGRAAELNAQIQIENLTGTATVDTGPRLAPTAAAGQALAPDATLAQPATAEPVDESAFTSRVVRGLSTMINQRGGVMTMRLTPPELGALRVQMSIIQGTVNAQFTATTAHAQALLENNLSTLRASLESHGLNVDQLRVQSAAPTDASNASRHEQADQERQHQQDSDRREREARDRSETDDHRANRRARFRMEHEDALETELAGAES